MAKSCNQKGKILYLQKMLSETTSQKPVTMQEILAKLEEQGIRAERKSIYDDMETLRDFGMDIHYRRVLAVEQDGIRCRPFGFGARYEFDAGFEQDFLQYR